MVKRLGTSIETIAACGLLSELADGREGGKMSTNATRQAKHRANNRTVWTFTITDPAIAKILDALKTKHGSDKAAIEHALKHHNGDEQHGNKTQPIRFRSR